MDSIYLILSVFYLYLPIYLSTYLPIYLSIYLSLSLPIYLYRSISTDLSLSISIYLYPSLSISIYLYLSLSISLSLSLPVCLPIYICLSCESFRCSIHVISSLQGFRQMIPFRDIQQQPETSGDVRSIALWLWEPT